MCCVLVGGTLLDVDLFIEQLTLRQQVKLFLAHSVPALRFHLNIDYSRKNEKESSSSQQFPPPPPARTRIKPTLTYDIGTVEILKEIFLSIEYRCYRCHACGHALRRKTKIPDVGLVPSDDYEKASSAIFLDFMGRSVIVRSIFDSSMKTS